MAFLALATFLTGCANTDTHEHVAVNAPRIVAASFVDLSRPEAHRHWSARPIDWDAVRRLSDVVYLNNVVALQKAAAAAVRPHLTGTVALVPKRAAVATPASSPGPGFAKGWDCVATAETGGNWSMHGSAYSSALGVMDKAVRENASPDVAAKILSGTATRAEQEAMASSIVAKHGVHAWAASTVAKCS